MSATTEMFRVGGLPRMSATNSVNVSSGCQWISTNVRDKYCQCFGGLPRITATNIANVSSGGITTNVRDKCCQCFEGGLPRIYRDKHCQCFEDYHECPRQILPMFRVGRSLRAQNKVWQTYRYTLSRGQADLVGHVTQNIGWHSALYGRPSMSKSILVDFANCGFGYFLT